MVLSLKVTRRAVSVSAAALALGLAACGPSPTPPAATDGASPAATTGGGTVSLSGAGATFPAPLYQRWFAEYNQQNPNVQISYQSVGSGAGVKQFLAKTVDFGATDAPLTDEEIKKYPAELGQPLQIPMTGGAVVFAYNLEGVDNLRLSRESFCGIVAGEIKTWNAPQLVKDNPGVNLPASPITFVHRSDGSGTTFIFTNHISAACPNWKAGAGKAVEWPTGTGGKGNEGVTAAIQQTAGSIGYTEFSYAKENNLKMATIQNRAGEFIVPSPESAAKAIEGVTVPADFALLVPNPEGKDAYPIVGLTWLLVYGKYDNPAKADALKSVIRWAYSDGAKFATDLGYLPIPNDVSSKALAKLDTIQVATK
jgi:phosphate transport system substrate-binding protein